MIEGFIIPAAAIAALQRVRVDAFNTMEPVPILQGAQAGNYFIDTAILVREPRLKTLIGTSENAGKLKAAGVTRVSLSETDLQPVNPARLE